MKRSLLSGFRIVLAASFVFCVAAHATAADGAPGTHVVMPPEPLWEVVELDGKAFAADVGGRRPNMRLLHGDSQVDGFTGCNRFFTDVASDEKGFRFTQPAMTRMGCMGKAGDAEAKFIASLMAVASRRMVDGQMELLDEKGMVRLRLQVVKPD